MDIVKQAKAYLMKDCMYCEYYLKMEDGMELCMKRQWNSISGHGAASIKKRYGFAALPIYMSRYCNQWKINSQGGNK